MTLEIGFNKFIELYSGLYDSGSLDLEHMAQIYQDKIGKIQKKITELKSQSATPASEQISKKLSDKYKSIYRIQSILELSIEAKNNYYQNTPCGKIAAIFQNLFKKIGFDTPIDKAKKVVDNCEKILKNEDALNQPLTSESIKQEDLESFADFSSIYARKTKEPYIHCIGNERNPSHILFAKPNGDVYVLPRNDDNILAHGSSRLLYKGYLYTLNKPPKEIAILTTLPNTDFTEVNTVFPEVTFKDMKEKHESLQNQKQGIEIPHNDFFTYHHGNGADEFNCAFAMMDLEKTGDLKTFLNSEKGSALTPRQKLSLMKSLGQTVYSRHQQDKIHRDINDKNILPYNDEDRNLKAKLIDFERYFDDNVGKEEEAVPSVVPTIELWPPEYLKENDTYLREMNAFINSEKDYPATRIKACEDDHKSRIAKATTPAMDIWQLGLVYFRIWYGMDLIARLVPNYSSMTDLGKIRAIKKVHQIIRNSGPEQTDYVGTVIKRMLDLDPKYRISAKDLNNPVIWQRIDGLLDNPETWRKTPEQLNNPKPWEEFEERHFS